MRDDAVGLYGLLLIGLIVWSFWPGAGDYWTDRLWHSITYGVAMDQVQINAKPKDCDFWHAPLGLKGCRFKTIVFALNAAGEVVGGDNSPKFRHDANTGKPIVSYDNGKSWEWWHGSAIPSDQKTKTVRVTWAKVAE